MKEANIGSSFDSWLEEEGFREQVTARWIKRVLARQIEAAKEEKRLSDRTTEPRKKPVRQVCSSACPAPLSTVL